MEQTKPFDKASFLQAALDTLRIEKQGLSALEKALNTFPLQENFCQIVEVILKSRGRVVVTGMGKSGHIGRKIAATLASTGTPAFFIHAAEASHGDLGMLDKNDTLLALSWSGETPELKVVLNHAARFRIPIAAITSGKQSALARQADFLLLLPKVEEACPHGLAPTTSSTLQLVLGDALAVSLLTARGFTKKEFKIFHPGGSLGAQLTNVSAIMHKGDMLPLVTQGTAMKEAMQVLAAKHFGCVVVVDKQGKLAGIVTEGDLARNIGRELSQLTVDDIMTTSPKTVRKDVLLSSATALLEQHKIGALLVVEEERPIGIVHFHDLLHAGVL